MRDVGHLGRRITRAPLGLGARNASMAVNDRLLEDVVGEEHGRPGGRPTKNCARPSASAMPRGLSW